MFSLGFNTSEERQVDWGFFRKSLKATRSTLKTLRAAQPARAAVYTGPIHLLGLSSVYTVTQCPSKVSQGLSKAYKAEEYGWATLAVMETALTVAEAFDSCITANSCLHGLCEQIPFSSQYSALMLPFAIRLTGASLLVKGFEIYQTRMQLNQKGDQAELLAVMKKDGRSIRERQASFQASIRKQRENYLSLATTMVAFCALNMLSVNVVSPVFPLAILTALSVLKLFTHLSENGSAESDNSESLPTPLPCVGGEIGHGAASFPL